MRDALLLVDVVNDFEHEDGDRLLESFRARHEGLVRALGRARAGDLPVVYANDNFGVWDGDAPRLVRHALAGRGAQLMEAMAPEDGDRFVVKPRYSAFDHTPLVLILRELEVERLLLAGASTEGCVAQTAIDARELGFKVSVLAQAAKGETRDGLRGLLRAEIVREVRRYPELVCAFRHGLLQEAALSTLTSASRRELYRRVASAFEQVYAGSLDDHRERLAHYHAQAGG